MLRNQASKFYFQKAISSWRKCFNNENACFIALLSTVAISTRYKKHVAPYWGEKVCLSQKSLFSTEGSILVFCKNLKTSHTSFSFLPLCYSHLLSLFEVRLWILCDWSFFMCNQCCKTFILVHSVWLSVPCKEVVHKGGRMPLFTLQWYELHNRNVLLKALNSDWCSDSVKVSGKATTKLPNSQNFI